MRNYILLTANKCFLLFGLLIILIVFQSCSSVINLSKNSINDFESLSYTSPTFSQTKDEKFNQIKINEYDSLGRKSIDSTIAIYAKDFNIVNQISFSEKEKNAEFRKAQNLLIESILNNNISIDKVKLDPIIIELINKSPTRYISSLYFECDYYINKYRYPEPKSYTRRTYDYLYLIIYDNKKQSISLIKRSKKFGKLPYYIGGSTNKALYEVFTNEKQTMKVLRHRYKHIKKMEY